MSKDEFLQLIDQTLALIVDTIETADKNGDIDVDYHGDIINLKTDKGQFVINKHSATKEIWLSSPVSGPHHFYHALGRWQTSTSIDLLALLTNELNINFVHTT